MTSLKSGGKVDEEAFEEGYEAFAGRPYCAPAPALCGAVAQEPAAEEPG